MWKHIQRGSLAQRGSCSRLDCQLPTPDTQSRSASAWQAQRELHPLGSSPNAYEKKLVSVEFCPFLDESMACEVCS